MNQSLIAMLAKQVRFNILRMTEEAQSGHPTSSLSAADIMTDLFFGGHLRFDLKDPGNPANDRVVFSKGHASPLVYAMWAAAGVISEKELLTYRSFGSVLEGHPTPRFKYAQVATGSLGQGLSVGVGMALALRAEIRDKKYEIRNLPNVYVLMGDSETAEGSVWEACELASYYKLSNLVAIVDVNRLGQSTETMLGWNLEKYKERFEAFGWETQIIDGHNFDQIDEAFTKVSDDRSDKPKVIIAKTIKGKGVSFWENKEGWHGKPLPKEEFDKAVKGLGDVDEKLRGEVLVPKIKVQNAKVKIASQKLKVDYKLGEEVATRKAYGEVLAQLAEQDPRIVALDGETSNSTFSELVRGSTPNQYFEMFIAEQNMAGVALGLSKSGKIPFASTFAAFWTRAFDQIRMAAYSEGNVKYVGSHAGVSIGEDGPSQMGLEDIAMFKTIFGSTVFCPSDAVSAAKLVSVMAYSKGVSYMRTARPTTPVIYGNSEEFKIGGSKVLRSSAKDRLTIVACGVVVAEALEAYESLKKSGVNVRVIDAYSIKPIDEKTLQKAAHEVGSVIVSVEDHHFEGGLGDSILNVFSNGGVKVIKMAVEKVPMSGKPNELLDYEGISADAICERVKEILK